MPTEWEPEWEGSLNEARELFDNLDIPDTPPEFIYDFGETVPYNPASFVDDDMAGVFEDWVNALGIEGDATAQALLDSAFFHMDEHGNIPAIREAFFEHMETEYGWDREEFDWDAFREMYG